MSVVIEKLRRARDIAWADLVPAFDHAIVLAEEAEALAEHAQNAAQTGCAPAYPPLVMKLAESVRDGSVHKIRQEVPWPPNSEATYMLTRFRCDCGWAGSTFVDARDVPEEFEKGRAEAARHMLEEVPW
ncbi:hypothetical protein [Leucobacter sp. VD1]|uniref:hypothetical protein n=1 Tax=Leucobacter sp. VD1 TaxID=3080381 RepID=UPI00301B24A8